MVEQVLDDGVMAVGGGIVQRAPAGLVDLHVVGLDHQPDQRQQALVGGHHQRVLAGGVGALEVEPLGADQRLGHVDVLVLERIHQQRRAVARVQVRVDTLCDELLHQRRPVVFDRGAQVVLRRGADGARHRHQQPGRQRGLLQAPLEVISVSH